MFYVIFHLVSGGASLMVQMIKNLLSMQETEFHLLDWDDFLEKGMATTPVYFPGEFHRPRSLTGCSSWGCESDMTEWLTVSGIDENLQLRGHLYHLLTAVLLDLSKSCVWFLSPFLEHMLLIITHFIISHSI